MKAGSKALAILSCRFSVERHLLILDPAAVGIHLLRIIKPASSLFVRHIAAVERETWKKTAGLAQCSPLEGSLPGPVVNCWF